MNLHLISNHLLIQSYSSHQLCRLIHCHSPAYTVDLIMGCSVKTGDQQWLPNHFCPFV